MDYTDFPKQLIYRERRTLEDFVEEHEENTMLIDNMLDNYYFSSADGKERARCCINTAYYLCTMILNCKKLPEWNFGKYCEIAYCGTNGNKIYQSFTLSLVYIFLTHTYYEVPCKKLLKKLHDFLNNITNFLVANDPFLSSYRYSDVLSDLLKNIPFDFLISEEFVPRKIDRDIFREVDGSVHWTQITNYYERNLVRDIVDFLGKNEEEKHLLIELIDRDAKRFYSANSGFYPETVKPMLEEMDKCIYHEYNDAINNDIFEAKMKELQHQGDLRPLQARIAELEAQLNKLQQNCNEQNYYCNSENEEELNRLLAENEELKLAIQSYKDQGKGLSAPEAAILITAICLEMNQIPANGREGLAPIIEFCWGKSSSTSSEALRRKVTEESAEKLARNFDLLTPKLARIIRELSQKLEERNNERLKQINPNVNK